MDTFSLRTFISVKEQQSFSKAAEQLLLTQPAVSKRIAALEQELGVRLFDRVGKRVLVTEAGRELYLRAKKICNEMDDCRRAMTGLAENMSGSLSFATSHHIGLHRLPMILQQFSAEYPAVELDIRFMDSEQAYAAVLGGTVEFALVTLAEERTISNLKTFPIWRDQLDLVVSEGHDLASLPDQQITAEVVAAFPAILPGEETHTRLLIDRAFMEFGLRPTVKLSTNYLETIRMLISVGLGWGVLPQTMIRQGEFRRIEVAGIDLSRSLGAIYHRQRTLSKSAKVLLAMLEGQLHHSC